MRLTLNEIAAKFGSKVAGDGGVVIDGVGTIESAMESELTFLANPKYCEQLKATRAAAVIVAPADRDLTHNPRIVTVNPYAYFAQVAALFAPLRAASGGWHASAVIESTAQVAATASIGALAYIGHGAKVGEDTVIHPHAYIGDLAVIGAQSEMYANSVVYARCIIGVRAIIHSGAVIGADGFGFAYDEDHWLKVPQTGRVVIGDDVEVGANTTIDRGAIDDTVIEDGVKLDNQIQIGHNVLIGAHTVIAGCAAIAGSTRIGHHCRIGGGVGIVGHLDICAGVTITARTLVTKSILDPGVYSSGVPHMENRVWLRTMAQWRRMEQMTKRIESLETIVKNIKGDVS